MITPPNLSLRPASAEVILGHHTERVGHSVGNPPVPPFFGPLDWKEPPDGGEVSAHKVQRRKRDSGDWVDIGVSVKTARSRSTARSHGPSTSISPRCYVRPSRFSRWVFTPGVIVPFASAPSIAV